jgi:hypothetical protein
MRRLLIKTAPVISPALDTSGSEVQAAYFRLDEVERSPFVCGIHIF